MLEQRDTRPFIDGEPPIAWLMVDGKGNRSIDRHALTLDAVPLWAFPVGDLEPVAWLGVWPTSEICYTFDESKIPQLESDGAHVMAVYAATAPDAECTELTRWSG